MSQLTDAQIDKTYDNRGIGFGLWNMPSTTYIKMFDLPGGGWALVLFIETQTLAPSGNKCCNSQGGISDELQEFRIKTQLEKIEKLLSCAKLAYGEEILWTIVVGELNSFSKKCLTNHHILLSTPCLCDSHRSLSSLLRRGTWGQC